MTVYHVDAQAVQPSSDMLSQAPINSDAPEPSPS